MASTKPAWMLARKNFCVLLNSALFLDFERSSPLRMVAVRQGGLQDLAPDFIQHQDYPRTAMMASMPVVSEMVLNVISGCWLDISITARIFLKSSD